MLLAFCFNPRLGWHDVSHQPCLLHSMMVFHTNVLQVQGGLENILETTCIFSNDLKPFHIKHQSSYLDIFGYIWIIVPRYIFKKEDCIAVSTFKDCGWLYCLALHLFLQPSRLLGPFHVPHLHSLEKMTIKHPTTQNLSTLNGKSKLCIYIYITYLLSRCIYIYLYIRIMYIYIHTFIINIHCIFSWVRCCTVYWHIKYTSKCICQKNKHIYIYKSKTNIICLDTL